MYWRYFLWNFAGKQNDVQGVNMGNVRDGNWKTGIGFFDKIRLGDQNKLPDTLKNNKANNKLFALPFILGILCLMYQVKKDKRDAFVTGLLFFFTGFAIVIYLNQAGNQPRERDYAYVGSFYAFAIWIGLAVVAFVKLAREKADKLTFQNGSFIVFDGLRTPRDIDKFVGVEYDLIIIEELTQLTEDDFHQLAVAADNQCKGFAEACEQFLNRSRSFVYASIYARLG